MTDTLVNEAVKFRGIYHVQIVDPDGTVVGDSGWKDNQITNEGFRWYLAAALGAIANSSQISYAALGSGGAPLAADTTLGGEVVKRAAVTAATSSNSKGVRFTATFASVDSFVTNTQNISNIGLFRSSSSGTLFAGNTYASSSCATNQQVQITYDITMA